MNVLLCVSVTSNRLNLCLYIVYIIRKGDQQGERPRRRRRRLKRQGPTPVYWSPKKLFPIIPRTASASALASAAWAHQNYADKRRVMNNQSLRRLRRHRRNRRHQSSDICVQRAMDEVFFFFLSNVCVCVLCSAARSSIHPPDDIFFCIFLFKYLFLCWEETCVYVCVFLLMKKKSHSVVGCHTFAWLAWVALCGQPLAFSPLGASHHEPTDERGARRAISARPAAA